jgi:predicted permease
MDTLLKDLQFAGRTLRQNPGFAATALLTIALGIGASTAIFSVVNAVLLRPLPYKDPGRLVLVWQELRARGVLDFPFPPGDFADLRQRDASFESVAAVNTGRQSIAGDGRTPEQVRTAFATTNLFSVLGVRVIAGRDFNDADGAPIAPPPQPAPGAEPGPPPPPPPPPSIILSHEFWKRRYGGDMSLVGQSIILGPPAREGLPPFRGQVVGVLEPGFELLFPPGTNMERRPDIFFANRTDFANGSRTNVNLRVIARMKPGVKVTDAQGDMDAFAADLRQRFPVKTTANLHINVHPMHGDLVEDVRPAILSLMGAVMFVLLIACANVANLLLARASRRERELAVRAALGSSRARLIRQMLAESLLISLLGAGLGLLLAKAGIRLLVAIGPESLPRLDAVRIDPWVLSFTALAAMISAVLFGLVPALRASRPNVIDILRKAGRSGNLGGSALRSGVVIVEVALSFVLLIGSGLMIRSFIALQFVDPGFDAKGVYAFQVPNFRADGPDGVVAFYRDVSARLAALPGVRTVTSASSLPLDGSVANLPYGPETAAADPRLMRQADAHFVQPGYFAAMKTRIVEGREFNEADNRRDVNHLVIDSVLAAKMFPGQPAVGKRLLVRAGTPTPTPFEIIGVSQQQRHASLTEVGREAVFLADGRIGPGASNSWAVRVDGDPMSIAAAVKAEFQKIDPNIVLVDAQPLSVDVLEAQGPTRFALVLIGIFAGIAALLASIGLYGVLSTLVRQRTAEIGVRMTFGADRRSIFSLIVGHGLKLSAIGVVVGLVAAAFLTRGMATMVVGIKPNDPLTFGAIAVMFFVIAFLACGIPALRASRLDPTTALRDG